VVLNWIEEGVALPFQRVPIPRIYDNKNIPDLESQFITEEIKRLVDCGAVVQLNQPPLICSPIHAVPKKEWEIPTRYRHALPKLSSGSTEVQNGGFRHTSKDGGSRRLLVHCRPPRWLPSHQHAQERYSIPRFSMERSILCLQSAPLRTGNITFGILKDNENNSVTSKTIGSQNSSVLRRFHRNVKEQVDGTKKCIPQVIEKFGPAYLAGKVKLKLRTRERVFRSFSTNHKQANVSRSTQEESGSGKGDIKDDKTLSRASTSSKGSKGSGTVHIPISCSGSNKIADAELIQRSQQEKELGIENTAVRRGYTRFGMVERCNGILGWEIRNPIKSGCDYIHRCKQLRLGRSSGKQNGSRILDSSYDERIYKLSRDDGSFYDTIGIQRGLKKQSGAIENRQHFDSSVCQQDDGTIGSTIHAGESNSKPVERVEHRVDGSAHSWSREYNSGSAIENDRQKRLETSPEILQADRNEMGTSLDRSDGILHQSPSKALQLLSLGPKRRSSGYLHAKLVKGKQLRKSAIQSDGKNPFQNQRRLRYLHRNSSTVASTALVSNSAEDVRRSANDDSEQTRHLSPRIVREYRATQQPEMGSSSIQSIWQQSTTNWSTRAKEILAEGLKPTTLKHYEAMWKRFLKYCEERNLHALPASEKTVVDFLAHITIGLNRPYGTVNQACSAIRQAHLAANGSDPTSSHLIKIFKSGVSNSLTLVPQKKATPVDIKPICNLFLTWKDNDKLPADLLRKKSLALCSFAGMLRPSDAARLLRKNIFFSPTLNYMDICLLGFKTDGQAKGEVFRIWKSSVKKLCPVQAIYYYIKKYWDSEDERIYPVGAQRISTLLKEVINAAGLDSSVITARSFRSGGATSGIQNGVQPDQLMKIGRWKTTDVFYHHYVAARPSQDTTDRMLGTLDNAGSYTSSEDMSSGKSSESSVDESSDTDSQIQVRSSRIAPIRPKKIMSSSDSNPEDDFPSDDSHEISAKSSTRKKVIEYYSSDHHSTTPSEDSDSSDSEWHA
jgi:hypothetical protein